MCNLDCETRKLHNKQHDTKFTTDNETTVLTKKIQRASNCCDVIDGFVYFFLLLKREFENPSKNV